MRPITQEFQLAAEYDSQDYTAAEFFRTMVHKDVYGGAYLSTSERILKTGEIFSTEVRMKTPSNQYIHATVDTVNLHSFRPKHPDTWFLSVYESWQQWNVHRLHQRIKG